MRWSGVLMVLMSLLLTACAMVHSQLIDEGPSGQCASEAGFYFLPKTHLLVEVKRQTAQNNEAGKIGTSEWHELDVKQLRLADGKRGYCLDYLRSLTHEENITVKKYVAQPVLGLVTSDSTDRSLEIAEALVRTIFTAISGNPNYDLKSAARNFGDAASDVVTMVRADYDPFDPERSAIVNHSLREFGFCLLLEHYTAPLDEVSIDQYCDDPHLAHKRHPAHRFEYKAVGLGDKRAGSGHHEQTAAHFHPSRLGQAQSTEAIRGLFYRPRIPYQLYVFVKKNMQARGGWKLRSTHPVPMENIAPILSIGVDRTVFAQRKTTLVFDEGMLKEACHFKGSELLEFSKLPLLVTQSVVALPANIIQVRIDQTQGLTDLINAQEQAIKTQTKYLATLNKLSDQVTAGQPTTRTVAKGFTPYTPPATTKKSDTDITSLNSAWSSACKPATAAYEAKVLSHELVPPDPPTAPKSGGGS